MFAEKGIVSLSPLQAAGLSKWVKLSILFYGAGVIGSIYAGKIKNCGHNITMLARGNRSNELREYGIILEHALTGNKSVFKVNVIENLEADDVYDLIIVTTRKNQVSEFLPILARNKTQTILFMINNPSGPDEWINAIGKSRLLLGFPSAAGWRESEIVKYLLLEGIFRMTQSTTIGEIDGSVTPRVKRIVKLFKEAGFNSTYSRNMDAWLKTHIAIVIPMASAIYKYNESNYELAKSKEGVKLLIQAVHEGFLVLKKLGFPTTPPKLNFLIKTPLSILVPIFQTMFNTKMGEVVLAKYWQNARDEAKQLADEFQELIKKTAVSTPAINELYKYI